MISEDANRVRALAEGLLSTNLKRGHDDSLNVDFAYLRPSPHERESQSFWHSCFHAIAMAHVDPGTAVRELQTLLATQTDDGFIGSTYHWGVRLGGMTRVMAFAQAPPGEWLRRSATIHPPVLAQAVERVGEIVRDAAFAPPFMQALDAYHSWLAEHRAPDDDGLLVIVSPNESGAGQSPTYDAAMGLGGATARWRARLGSLSLDVRNWRAGYDSATMLKQGRFRVKDAMANGLYADSLATMARLHRAQGNPRVAEAYDSLAARVTGSMLDKMLERERGGFASLTGKDERRVAPLTIGSLVPLVMEGVPDGVVHEIVDQHLLNRDEFWLRYPLPSVAANEASFDARDDRMTWRGPTSVATNWLVWRGLRRHGLSEAAEQLAARTLSLVARSGLREFYNPLNGQGMGAKNFAWSALAFDMTDQSG